jgi:hypothetical protein
MPRKVFTAGEVLAAADVNEFLQDQAVMTFAGTAARGSAIGTATLGMYTHLEDTPQRLQYWNGSAWTASTGWTSKGLGQHRFAQLGGSLFVVNGVNDMMSSTNGASWVTTNCPTSLVLSYITRYRGRLVAMTTNGTVYFSSIINPSVSPFITWTPSTDFFRVNPDDGGYASGFATVGNVLLIFKNNGFYRTDITNEFVVPDDLYQVGAISQEAITVSQGMCFFYSGTSIYKTDGSAYPQDIARTIQAYIDLISNKSDVYMTSNEHYVYLEVGSIVIDGITYSNVVFRYSIRNFSTKDVKVMLGPCTSLNDIITKRIKRRSIVLVRKSS